jgi:hypothetical protein
VEAVELVERYYDPSRIRPVTQDLIEEILSDLGQARP